MKPSDLLSELSVKIYEPPLSQVRDSGKIADISSPVSVVMLLLDFETEVTMNGIVDFLGNSTGLYARETVLALKTIGCSTQAEKLDEILSLASQVGMTNDAIQSDRSGLRPFAVCSFSDVHGKKWDSVMEPIDELNTQIDFDELWEHAEAYVAANKAVLESALRGTA